MNGLLVGNQSQNKEYNMKITGWILLAIGGIILGPDLAGMEVSEAVWVCFKTFLGMFILLLGSKLVDAAKRGAS